jgi:hypothetical protein
MPKLTLTGLANLQNETSAINAINNNNTSVETAIENTLSRDGTSPNTMAANIDMNSNKLINVADPTNNQDVVTKAYGDANYGGASATAAEAAQTAAEAAQTDAEAAQTAAEAAQANAETAQGLAETAQAAAELAETNAVAATATKADDDLSNVDPATGRTALGLVIGIDVLAPNGDGSSLTGITAGATADELARIKWLEDNLALNTIRDIVDAGWTIQEMVDGFSDAFTDETGVDAADSTNEAYNAAGDYYGPLLPTTSYANSGGTGNRTGDITVTDHFVTATVAAGQDVTKLVEGTLAAASGTNSFSFTNTTITAGDHIKFDFGSSQYIDEIKYYRQTTTDYGTWAVEGSDDDSAWTAYGSFTWNQATQTVTLSGVPSGGHRYWRWVCTTPANTYNGWHYEIEFKIADGASTDYTLVSEVQTADAQPDTARGVLVVQPVDSITLNTDLICEITRDNGTTWTAGTLAEEADYDANSNVYATANVNLTGQDPDTSMRIRVRTLNNKEVRVHAWTLQWR